MFRLFLLAFLIAAPASAEPMSADDIRADFQQLYETLQQDDPDLYSRIGKPEYDSIYQTTLNSFTEALDLPEVAKRFQRFVAAGGTSRTRIDASYAAFLDYKANGGRTMPLYVKLVHGRYYVSENRSGVKGIRRGEEIYAINREPIREVYARAARNLSADTAYMAQTQLEVDFPMALWLDLGPKVDHIELTFARRRTMFHKTVPFLTEREMLYNAQKQAPVLAINYRERMHFMIGDAGYIRPGWFHDEHGGRDDREFRYWIEGVFRQFLSHDARVLLIDLRDNPGGGESFALDLMKWFAPRPFRLHQGDELIDPRPVPRYEGKIYLLINRNTFSACTVLAAAIQDQHFGVILGERTSDLATGETTAQTFRLEHSKLVVGYPIGHMVRPAGEEAPRWVLPDVLIDTPVIEDPDDPVLQQAFDMVTK